VRASVRNAGFEFPSRRLTVNLAPAEVPKEGPGFDLAVAAASCAPGSTHSAARQSRVDWACPASTDDKRRLTTITDRGSSQRIVRASVRQRADSESCRVLR
jgi:predicted ATPase with chaperone activity